VEVVAGVWDREADRSAPAGLGVAEHLRCTGRPGGVRDVHAGSGAGDGGGWGTALAPARASPGTETSVGRCARAAKLGDRDEVALPELALGEHPGGVGEAVAFEAVAAREQRERVATAWARPRRRALA